MVMHWPQITWIALAAISLMAAAVLDGDDRTGKHKFSVTVYSVAVSAWLLWSGGFFG